jgi:hypothetical protein
MKQCFFASLLFFLSSSAGAQGIANPQSSLSEIDFNYLNKGVWELNQNGYMPREDLKMVNLYGAKQQTTEWYFMCHKICKNGVDLGYVITGKPNSASTIVHNLFFLKQSSPIATAHNEKKIDNLSTLGLDRMFLFRSTTVDKYNLQTECPR